VLQSLTCSSSLASTARGHANKDEDRIMLHPQLRRGSSTSEGNRCPVSGSDPSMLPITVDSEELTIRTYLYITNRALQVAYGIQNGDNPFSLQHRGSTHGGQCCKKSVYMGAPCLRACVIYIEFGWTTGHELLSVTTQWLFVTQAHTLHLSTFTGLRTTSSF
jgi:hypothetical protein